MNICYLNFSMQSFETGIHLQDTSDRRYNTKQQSQYEHDNCRPKCSPLEFATPVEPPLRQCPWPGTVISPLYFAKPFLPIWIAIQVKHFLGSYGRLYCSLDIYVVLFADATRSFRRLEVRWWKQERQRPFSLREEVLRVQSADKVLIA
jgi:hypothetical protein